MWKGRMPWVAEDMGKGTAMDLGADMGANTGSGTGTDMGTGMGAGMGTAMGMGAEKGTAEVSKVLHPARYGALVIETFIEIMRDTVPIPEKRKIIILDPFAGVGTIHEIRRRAFGRDALSVAVEIEQEWADAARAENDDDVLSLTWRMDARDLVTTLDPRSVDVIATSPAYGNRMADNHTPGAGDTSRRITYRHSLGRPLSEGSAAGMQWGERYRDFHDQIWADMWRLMRPGGLFLLNVKDHIRKGKVMKVSAWHLAAALRSGFELEGEVEIPAAGMRYGANGAARVAEEVVFILKAGVRDGDGEDGRDEDGEDGR